MWPTQVEREVSERVVAKWAKSLELCGRLALVLFHEEARRETADDPVRVALQAAGGLHPALQHRGHG